MIAEVAVFGFTLKPVTYTYLVPEVYHAQTGQLVTVPFGKNSRRGVIVSVGRKAPVDIRLKEIKDFSATPVITREQIGLATFIAERYFISVAEALHLMLPRFPNPTSTNQKLTKAVTQELCLFPTLRQASAAAKTSEGIVFSHASQAKEFDDIWSKIASGEARRIFGPRSAIFAPFLNLKKISIFQTESDIYKEERRPYYRTFELGLALARLHSAQVRGVSFSPRVQDHYKLPHHIKKILPPVKAKTVNLRQMKILNPQLLSFLEDSRGKKTLVFLNRKSERGALSCRVCKVRSFVQDASVCPNCGSSDVKFELFNLSTLAKQVSASVSGEITFATQQIFFQDLGPFDAIALASADHYLNSANYLSTEKTFQMVTDILRLLKPGGSFLIQTAHPEEPAIKFALQGDYLSFYEDELKKRKEMGYPPFAELAKLIYSQKTKVPDIELGDLQVFGPFQNGKFPYLVVRGSSLAKLEGLVRPWKLDIDPLNL